MNNFVRFTSQKDARKHISDNIDIVAAVATILDAGPSVDSGQNVKWPCPFHTDNTPSFNVSRDKKFLYCFGCKESFDVVGFYARVMLVTTDDAISALAALYNIDITSFLRPLSDYEQETIRLLKINSCAQEYLANSLLHSDDGKQALEYLVIKRNVPLEFVDKYNLGYSYSVDGMINWLRAHDIEDKDISKLHYNRSELFNRCITYPITNIHGNIYYYWAKSTVNTTGPKYISPSSDHPLYNEILPVFGAHVRKRGNKSIYIVEGQHDTIALNVALGVNTIALCGVSKFNRHIYNSLKRYGYDNIVLMFDGDEAGINGYYSVAINNDFIKDIGLTLSIAKLPSGDPDSLINSGLISSVQTAIENNCDIGNFIVDHYYNKDKNTYLNELVTLLVHYSPRLKLSALSRLSFYSKIDINNLIEIVRNNTISELLPTRLESNLLLSLVKDHDSLRDYIIDENIFSNPDNRQLFHIIKRLYDDHRYLTTDLVINYLASTNSFSFLTDRFNRIITNYEKVDISSSLDLLIDLKFRRDAHKSFQNIMSSIADPKMPMLSVIDDISSVTSSMIEYKAIDVDVTTPDGLITSAMMMLTERMASESKLVGIDLGPRFNLLTRHISGLWPGHLNTIAALWGVGKTALAINWAIHMGIERQEPVPTLFISGEMTRMELVTRILAMLSGVAATKISEGNLTSDEYALVVKSAAKFKKGKLYITESRNTLSDWLGLINLYRMKYGCINVFIDYIQLLVTDKNSRSPFYLQVGDASSELKGRANRDNNKLIINIISQLSAGAADQQIQSSLHTGAARKIAQDSDRYFIVQALRQEEIVNRGIEQGNRLLIIDKDRHTGQSGKIIDMVYDNNDDRRLVGSLRMGEALSWINHPLRNIVIQ